MFNLTGFNPVVLILAAGRSERFRAAGGQGNKLDAQLITAGGTRSVLDHVIAAAKGSSLQYHIVFPADTARYAEQGMGTSISAGVTATADASGWLILPGDLPFITAKSINLVANALRHFDLVAPFFQNLQGHPIGFGRQFRDELLGLRGDSGARSVLLKNQVHRLHLEDDGCVFDVDTPELLIKASNRV